jgi:hypothetical protein
MLTKSISAVAVLLYCVVVASAQDFGVETQRLEMKKLESMTGHWEGSGWMQHGPARETFHGVENVQSKLDGLAILVEGKFLGPDKSTGVEKIVHETLAVLSFDPKAAGYKFRTYLATGSNGEFDAHLVEGGWQWGFSFTGGSVRYTIKLTGDTWSETGEFSRDGTTWMKNFEMTLKKVVSRQ